MFTDAVASHLIAACHDAGIMVVADPKGRDFSRYHGVACLTPNSAEAAAAAEISIARAEDALAAAERLSAPAGADPICAPPRAEGVPADSATGGPRLRAPPGRPARPGRVRYPATTVGRTLWNRGDQDY